MKLTWRFYVGVIIIIVLSLIGYAGYLWVDGNSELWYDQGTVNWMSPQEFTTAGSTNQWVNDFSIVTLHHGVLNFTTLSETDSVVTPTICLHNPGYCQGNQGGALKINTLYGLVKHKNGNIDLVIAPR